MESKRGKRGAEKAKTGAIRVGTEVEVDDREGGTVMNAVEDKTEGRHREEKSQWNREGHGSPWEPAHRAASSDVPVHQDSGWAAGKSLSDAADALARLCGDTVTLLDYCNCVAP